MIWRFLSTAIFALTVGSIAYLLIYTPIDERLSDIKYTPSIAYLVQPGSAMEFSLPMGLKKVRITSRIANSTMDSPPTWWQGYQFHVRWKDIDGNVIHEQDYHERTRTSRFPSPEEEPYRRAFLAGIGEPLPDARITIVAGEEILPEGGSIEVSLLDNSPPLYFNATGEEFRSDVAAQQRLLSLAAHQKDKLVRRLGIISWSMLNEAERWALVQHEWKSLAPKGQINRDFTSAWIMQSDYELPWSYPQLMGTTLSQHRALALNLVGPVTLRLSGPKEIENLQLYTIADAPDEAILTEVTLEKDRPIGLSMEERGFKLELTHEGPISLHLKNNDVGDIGPIIFSVDNPKSEQFFGWTLGALLRELMPNSYLRERETAIIGPEWWYAEYYETGELPIALPPPLTDTPSEIIVDIRAHLSGFEDKTQRSISLQGIDSSGEVIWTRGFSFEPVAAPYEYYRPDDPNRDVSTWISERVRVYVPYTPEVHQIQITSEDRLLIIPQVLGPPIGEKDSYGRPYRTTLLRFPRFAYTSYHRLPALNATELDLNDQLVKIASNVRLELYPESKVRPGEIAKYRLLELDTPPLQWLIQTKDMNRSGPLYCRIQSNRNHRFQWDAENRQRLQSSLDMTVIVPNITDFGTEYKLITNGGVLFSDRIIQEIQHHRVFAPNDIQTLRLEGPAGLTGWVRSYGSPYAQCDLPRRSMGFWTLAPGETRTVRIPKDKLLQRILVTGLSLRDGVLGVTIDGGETAPNEGIHEGWTERNVILELPRTNRPVAYQLRTPNVSAGILEAQAVLMKQDLELGDHSLTLKNIGDAPLHFRLLLETDHRQVQDLDDQPWSFSELE